MESTFEKRQLVGLVLGPLFLVVMQLLPAPEGMSEAAWNTASVAMLMATWWITEAIPIPITSLIPIVLFPIMGVLKIGEATAPYADPVVYMFMGGFIIALAMEKWNLHKRIALGIIQKVGTSPERLIFGFMLSAAFISMWINNTATTMMMLPIALSVVRLLYSEGENKEQHNFVVVLMLAIAHASTIGGIGTLIGTAPNMFFAGFMSKTYGIQIGFLDWMLAVMPLVFLSIPLVTIILTRLVFPIKIKEIEGAKEMVTREKNSLGSLSVAEKWVGFAFILVAFLWVFKSLSEPVFGLKTPFLSDAGIGITGCVILFLIPLNLKRGVFVMDWQTASKLPWELILLFGGGLSLAEAIGTSGLAVWIGNSLSALSILPTLLLLFCIVVLTIILTEFTSNTALTATLLPVLGPVALQMGENPLLLLIPATIAASTGFMMPVGTPPNAIVYGTGYIKVTEMIRAGIWLNLLFAVLVTALAYTLITWVFGIQFGQIPDWAR
ncbi:MAG: DASS family sodium-coupled anion symporter [Bacteroidetes Order II. Incertae sedis bacterium]|nr:DASS family sodium-coupled anion symporter [Bacteroidetes Order II. bacterium]